MSASPALSARLALRVPDRHERLRRDEPPGVLEDLLDALPVRLWMEGDAQPAAGPDVRRAKERLRVFVDQGFLLAGRGRDPKGEPAVAAETAEVFGPPAISS